MTAGGKSHLKLLPLARLKKYANAYNIKVNGVLEKDDLINALISVRVGFPALFDNGVEHSVVSGAKWLSSPYKRSTQPFAFVGLTEVDACSLGLLSQILGT